MSKNGNKEKEFFSSSFINISLIITILLIIILPSVIKMNKGYFWVGIIISFFLMNIFSFVAHILLLVFFEINF